MKPDEEYGWLIRLYVLCEKFQDLEAKNTVLTAIFTKSNEMLLDDYTYFANVTDVTYHYDGTPVGCLASNLLVVIFVQEGYAGWMMVDGAAKISKDFLFDLTVALFKLQSLREEDRTKLRKLEMYLEDAKMELIDTEDADVEEAITGMHFMKRDLCSQQVAFDR